MEASESARMLVYVLPGIFSTAAMTGRLRRELQQELDKFDISLNTLGYSRKKGWIIAVTDGDEVSYYVEKCVSLTELMQVRLHFL